MVSTMPLYWPALIWIAMGGLGSDAAIEAADVVIMTDEPSKIASAIRIAKKTLGIARQNTIFSLGVKIVVLALSAFGLASLWWAVFADVGVTVIAVFNSFRALAIKKI
jgi:Cd2+/Zn2+-exporting ATPase